MGYTVHTDFFIEGRHALLFAVNGRRGRAFDLCLSPEHRVREYIAEHSPQAHGQNSRAERWRG